MGRGINSQVDELGIRKWGGHRGGELAESIFVVCCTLN